MVSSAITTLGDQLNTLSNTRYTPHHTQVQVEGSLIQEEIQKKKEEVDSSVENMFSRFLIVQFFCA